jgi:hypothetical protein
MFEKCKACGFMSTPVPFCRHLIDGTCELRQKKYREGVARAALKKSLDKKKGFV